VEDPTVVPEDEPVFLLRGQDIAAPDVIRYWAKLVEQRHGAPEIVKLAREQADKMYDWQRDHKMKLPDLPGATS
jgi:hypothetical protein